MLLVDVKSSNVKTVFFTAGRVCTDEKQLATCSVTSKNKFLFIFLKFIQMNFMGATLENDVQHASGFAVKTSQSVGSIGIKVEGIAFFKLKHGIVEP